METKNKLCVKCKIQKDLEDFYFKKTENRYDSWCKNCVYTLQKKRWIDRKKKAVELMGGKCCICGYNKNCAALDFHHVDPSQKVYEWTDLKTRPWKAVIEELKKCVLLCRNCHAETHWPENSYESSDNNFLNKKIISTGNCPICESEVFGTIHCSTACSSVSKRKIKRPTINELKILLEQNNFCSIARIYGVSDNAVRKWAKTYGLL